MRKPIVPLLFVSQLATVPLALVSKNLDKFSASTILYAGVSYFVRDTSEKGLQETFERLLNLCSDSVFDCRRRPRGAREAVREAVTSLLAEFRHRDPLYAEMASKFSFFSGEAVYPEDGDNLDELLSSAGRRLTAARVAGPGGAPESEPLKLAAPPPTKETTPVWTAAPEPDEEPELVVPGRLKKPAEPVAVGSNPGPAPDNGSAKRRRNPARSANYLIAR